MPRTFVPPVPRKPQEKKPVYLFNLLREPIQSFSNSDAALEYLKITLSGLSKAIREGRVIKGAYYVSRQKELLQKKRNGKGSKSSHNAVDRLNLHLNDPDPEYIRSLMFSTGNF